MTPFHGPDGPDGQLTELGRVPTTTTRRSHGRVVDEVRAADPLHRSTVTEGSPGERPSDEQDHLDRLRAVLQERLEHQPASSSSSADGLDHSRRVLHGSWSSTWQRRAVAAAAAAAVAAGCLVAVRAVAPHVLDGVSGPDLVTAGISVSGQVTCATGGYADPVPAASAAVRLLPEQLPSGWSVTGVLARSSTSDSPCAVPSLFALATDGSGTVEATVSVVGPVHVDLGAGSLGTASATTVDGHPGRLFDLTGGAGPDDRFTRWVWTDEHDQTWQLETSGYDLAQARAAVAGVSTDGDQVSFTAALPGLRVVHQRTGEPVAGQEAHLDWTVSLSDGAEPRHLDVLSALRGDDAALTRTWLEQYAVVGARLTSIGGHPALVGPAPADASADGSSPVVVQLDPRTVVWMLAEGDLDDVGRVVASLRQVSRDDPRLAPAAQEQPPPLMSSTAG